MMILRIGLLILAATGLALAQDAPAPDTPASTPADTPVRGGPEPSHATTGPKSPEWASLTVGEKLRYDWAHMFGVENMIFAGIGASFDQARNRPSEWGQGWEPFAERYASHVGYYIVQRSI